MLNFFATRNHQGGRKAFQISPAQRAIPIVLLAMAYLSLVNLDYATFWEDEAIAPVLARNLLLFGAPTADDGRNVLSYLGGEDIRSDLTFRYPPGGIYLQAAVFGLFGVGEVQARMLMALLTLAAMLLFADVLRREFPDRPDFIALAMLFACLSPITLGYARSATYNSPLLFFNIFLFWSYLRFCVRPQIKFAVLAAIAAVAGFHTHYLGNGVFVAALGIFHLLFRRSCFDCRAWLIAGSMAIGYGLMVLWFLHAEYSTGGYAGHNQDFSFGIMLQKMFRHIAGLNKHLLLVWPVALWLVVYSSHRVWQASSSGARATESCWQVLQEDRIFQYFVLVLTAAIILSLTTPQPLDENVLDVRYLTSAASFAAIVTAGAIAWVWRCFKPVGWLAGAVLLLSNLGGWPFLDHRFFRNSPLPTLPALAVEYHYDYPGPSRAAFAYLREHVPQDDIVWIVSEPSTRTMYYLSDRVRICCILRRNGVPEAMRDDKRSYLFRENIDNGTVKPDWILFFGDAPEAWLIKYGNWHYRLAKEIPGMFVEGRDPQRPEPGWHAAFALPDFGGPHRVRFYRAVPDAELPDLLRQAVPAS